MILRFLAVAGLLLLVAGPASPAGAAEDGGLPPSTTMAQAGDEEDPALPLPGFGALAVAALSYRVEPEPDQEWKDTKDGRSLKLGAWNCELRTVPADWQALRARLPGADAKDRLSVRKVLWTGVTAWLIEVRASRGAPGQPRPPCTERHLVAPVADGFLLLSFKGPADQFTEQRPAMRRAALALRFEVNGLVAEYCNSLDLTHRQRVQVDPCIDFGWDQGAPSADVGPDVFSIRWTGKLRPRFTETYTFTTTSDDGVRLWLNDKLLIDNWTEHPATDNTAAVDLAAGQEYDLKVEWFENYVHATIRLAWQSASQIPEIVPPGCLFSRPEPFIVPAPEPPPKPGEEYGGLPALPYGTQPGGYVSENPEGGARWQGQRGNQSLTVGKGPAAIHVTLRTFPLRVPQARTALPQFIAADQVKIQSVLWQDAPCWLVEASLDAAAHADQPLRHQRHYLVPLRSTVLLLSFASAEADWYSTQRAAFMPVLNSVKLTTESQDAPREATGRDVF